MLKILLNNYERQILLSDGSCSTKIVQTHNLEK